jgi:5-oxoprolinase (ATP-hydrolysing)
VLHKFQLRENSGGRGRYRGGDGLVRDVEFLQPLEVSLLSERRCFAPYGIDGGEEGRRGMNLLLRVADVPLPFHLDLDPLAAVQHPDSSEYKAMNLGGKAQFKSRQGDRLIVLTPGGGGCGIPE